MKKILLIFAFLPLLALGQIPPGANFLIPADTGATLPRLATGHDIRGWTWSNDTLHSPYNVWLDSSFLMNYNGNYLGWGDNFGYGLNGISIGSDAAYMELHPGDSSIIIRTEYLNQITLYNGFDGDNSITITSNGESILINGELFYTDITSDSLNIIADPVNISSGSGTQLLVWRDTIYGVNGSDTLRIFPTL